MNKKIIIAIIVIAIIIAGVFIGIKTQTKEKGDSLQKVLSKKTFILGLDDSFPPMGFRNENNEIVGFDIDVAREVCKRLNVELVVQPISWTAKEQELNSYNIDCIWNGMSINNDRKEAMCLSNPYLKNNMTFVVKKDSNINSINDLKGKKVGVQAGSTAESMIVWETMPSSLLNSRKHDRLGNNALIPHQIFSNRKILKYQHISTWTFSICRSVPVL